MLNLKLKSLGMDLSQPDSHQKSDTLAGRTEPDQSASAKRRCAAGVKTGSLSGGARSQDKARKERTITTNDNHSSASQGQHTGSQAPGTLTSRESDQLLVARVQKGDKRAFDLLVIKYQHKILAIISRFVRDSAEVNDVAQEAFIKAYRALGNFRGESAFYTWMYRIAINTAKNHLVSRSRRPPAYDVELDDEEFYSSSDQLQDQETPENLLFRDELQAVVNRTIEQLPEDLRTAVTLREFDGLSYEEIAEVMECPMGTVRSRIFRAREAIDTQVKALMEGRL